LQESAHAIIRLLAERGEAFNATYEDDAVSLADFLGLDLVRALDAAEAGCGVVGGHGPERCGRVEAPPGPT
jgi:hypothetical protein